VTETKRVVKFLRDTALHWRRTAIRLRDNEIAVVMCEAKANVLEGVAEDIEGGLHK
jgi:hypothetical protein